MASRTAAGYLTHSLRSLGPRVRTTSTLSPLITTTPSPCYTSILIRYSSHSPMGTPPSNPRKKVTLQTLRNLYKKGEPISVLTAHDFPSGHVAEVAGMDIILVGDSLAMVALGMEDTSEVVMEEMLLHCKSVARAARSAFTVSLLSNEDFG